MFNSSCSIFWPNFSIYKLTQPQSQLQAQQQPILPNTKPKHLSSSNQNTCTSPSTQTLTSWMQMHHCKQVTSTPMHKHSWTSWQLHHLQGPIILLDKQQGLPHPNALVNQINYLLIHTTSLTRPSQPHAHSSIVFSQTRSWHRILTTGAHTTQWQRFYYPSIASFTICSWARMQKQWIKTKCRQAVSNN